jgi:hypothetical protein
MNELLTCGELGSPPEEELKESLATGTRWSSGSKLLPSNVLPSNRVPDGAGGRFNISCPIGFRSKSTGRMEGWAWI